MSIYMKNLVHPLLEDRRYRKDLERALEIIKSEGLSLGQARSFFRSFGSTGSAFSWSFDTPEIYKDTRNPINAALKILILADMIVANTECRDDWLRERNWNRYALMLDYPVFSNFVKGNSFKGKQQIGGSRLGPLRTTIKAIVRDNPNISILQLLSFMKSEDAWDKFDANREGNKVLAVIDQGFYIPRNIDDETTIPVDLKYKKGRELKEFKLASIKSCLSKEKKK